MLQCRELSNGKLTIDNTAQLFGQPFQTQVYTVVVTAMGTLYNTATPPTIAIAAPPAGTTATATPNIDDATGTLRLSFGKIEARDDSKIASGSRSGRFTLADIFGSSKSRRTL